MSPGALVMPSLHESQLADRPQTLLDLASDPEEMRRQVEQQLVDNGVDFRGQDEHLQGAAAAWVF